MPTTAQTVSLPAHEVLRQVGEHLRLLQPDFAVDVPFQGTVTEVMAVLSTQLPRSASAVSFTDFTISDRPSAPGALPSNTTIVESLSASAVSVTDSAISEQPSAPGSLPSNATIIEPPSTSAVSTGLTRCPPGRPAIFPNSDPARQVVCSRPRTAATTTPIPGTFNPPPPALTPFPSAYQNMEQVMASSKSDPISLFSVVPLALRFDHIPVVAGSLAFPSTFEGTGNYYFETTEVDLVWDTGASVCMAAQELFPDELLRKLKLNHSRDGDDILCPIEIRLLPVKRRFRSHLRLRPRSKMPSQFCGILLGHDNFLSRFQFTLTPAGICELGGRHLNPDQHWGILELHKYQVGDEMVDPIA